MEAKIWIGGIVVLIEEPRDQQGFLTHYIPLDEHDKFKAALHKGRLAVKSIQGPLINGVWAITFDVGQDDSELFIESMTKLPRLITFCQKIFTQFAEKIERGNAE